MSSLIGHSAARNQLAALLAAGRVPHALLLHGPRGIGKATLARQLAWRLICGPAEAPEEAGPDMFGESAPTTPADDLAYDSASPQAAQLAAGSCPDFHELTVLDDKKSISIKQIREILEVLLRSADTARVCIVDSIDDLTPEAANTLLKTLEEPRPGIYFLLISHQLGKVLPTIRSRCRLLRLSPLSPEETRQVLLTQGEDATLTTLAAGCPGMVLGEGAAARRKLTQQIADWQHGTAAKPKILTDEVYAVLQQRLAQPGRPPTLMEAEAYQAVTRLAKERARLNLPAALAAEAALNALPERE